MRNIFVTGAGTDVGKTVVSAILVEALGADYWKPVQTGSALGTDTEKIKKLIQNEKTIFHEEKYLLQNAISPHAAAKLEEVTIEIDEIELPETNNHIVIEGAGGILVPINRNYFIVDLIRKFDPDVFLVYTNYLGSINHTLLTIEALKQRNINIKGIVFNGQRDFFSEEIILHHGKFKSVYYVEKEKKVNQAMIFKYAEEFKKKFIDEEYI